MARKLEELQRQYHGSSKPAGGPGGPGGPHGGRGGNGAKGKPKNLKKTVSRLLSYVGKSKALN